MRDPKRKPPPEDPHGYIRPRPGSPVARCGGPDLCAFCCGYLAELQEWEAEQQAEGGAK